MRNRVLRPLAFAPLLIATALSACSSSSDGGPTSGTDSSTTPDTAIAFDSSSGTDTTTPGDTSVTPTDTAGTDGAPAGDTWDSFAMGFFAKYCTECHSGGTRDYRTPPQVKRDMALIRCGVASVAQTGCGAADPKAKQFPINNATKTNPKPTDAERDRIVAWLAAGLP